MNEVHISKAKDEMRIEYLREDLGKGELIGGQNVIKAPIDRGKQPKTIAIEFVAFLSWLCKISDLLHRIARDRRFIPLNAQARTLGCDLAVFDLIMIGQNARSKIHTLKPVTGRRNSEHV